MNLLDTIVFWEKKLCVIIIKLDLLVNLRKQKMYTFLRENVCFSKK